MKALFIGGSLHGKIQEHQQCDHIVYPTKEGEELYNVYSRHGEKYSLFVYFEYKGCTFITDLLNTFDISEKDIKWEPAMDARPRTLNCRSVALPLNCKQTNAYARHIVLYLYELKVNRKIDDYLINEYPRNSRVTCTLLKEDTKTDVHLYDGDDIVSKLNGTIAVIDSQLNRVKEQKYESDKLIVSFNGIEISNICTEEEAIISIDHPKTYEDINGILRYTDNDQAVNAISALNTVRKIR